MWQVSGRSNITDFEEVVELDREYISHWNMGLDFSEKISKEDLDAIQYPVVVKAVDQSANRGMSYCFSSDEMDEAVKKARAVSNHN